VFVPWRLNCRWAMKVPLPSVLILCPFLFPF